MHNNNFKIDQRYFINSLFDVRLSTHKKNRNFSFPMNFVLPCYDYFLRRYISLNCIDRRSRNGGDQCETIELSFRIVYLLQLLRNASSFCRHTFLLGIISGKGQPSLIDCLHPSIFDRYNSEKDIFEDNNRREMK